MEEKIGIDEGSAPGLRISVSVNLDEAKMLVEALGTLDAEYGLGEIGHALLTRMREAATRLAVER